MSYAMHILNITQILKRKLHWYMLSSPMVHLSFHADFILCSVFTLKICVLNWTWSWPVALVDIIYYNHTQYNHTHTYTQALCSEQSHCKTNQFLFLPPDESRWLDSANLMTKGHWPTFTSSLLNLQVFVVGFLFHLWRCHSIFSCCLHYSLHSAILSWKKK